MGCRFEGEMEKGEWGVEREREERDGTLKVNTKEDSDYSKTLLLLLRLVVEVFLSVGGRPRASRDGDRPGQARRR